MLKFKIKQADHINKMKLNKRFSKKIQIAEDLKGTATDMRYFTRSKFFRSLVHKKNFSLI